MAKEREDRRASRATPARAYGGAAPPVLEAVKVFKRFGPLVALDGVTLAVAEGEVVALVGESGSGKSTLLRTFNHTVEPDRGDVFFRGRKVADLEPVALRRKMGFVQQGGGLLPHWTVLRNASLVPWLRGDRDAQKKGREALLQVGLSPEMFGGRWPRQLSGGQRQRVALARALAHEPEVVLLDEPFGALDAISRAELQEVFEGLVGDIGITALFVTHDIHEAFLLADRVAVLYQGRIEQVADPATLIGAPATEYVERLLERARVA